MRRIFARTHRYRYRCVRTGPEVARETKDGAKNTTGAGVCAIASWHQALCVLPLRHATLTGRARELNCWSV